MSGANQGNANANANAIANMFGDFAERVRVLRHFIRAPPFQAFRVNILMILGFIGNGNRAALREPVLAILENLFNPQQNPPEQGELINRLRQDVIQVLRVLINHPNHPELSDVIRILQAMIVRDQRLGFALENPLLGRFIRILYRVLDENANLPVPLQHQIIVGLGRLFQRDILIQQIYDDERVRRLQYTASLFELFLNHPLIVGQANREVQNQFLNRLIDMLMQPGNYTNEHFELLLLMGQLLVEANGFDEALQERLRHLLINLHQDPQGHAFIENFENILMEIIAEDEEEVPEPSTASVESQQTQEYIRPFQRRRLNDSPQSSSVQSNERRLNELGKTAESKPPTGGKAKPVKKPVAKQAKKPAKKK